MSSSDMERQYSGGGTDAGLLRKREVADLLVVSVRSVDRLIASGDLPRVRLGGSIRFRLEDVRNLVERSREDVRDLGGSREETAP